MPVFILDAASRIEGSAGRRLLGRALAAFDAGLAARTGEHITVLEGEAAEPLPARTARLLYPTAMQGYQDLSFNDQVLRRRAAIAEYRALVQEKRKELENSACAVLRQEFALP